VRAWWLRCSSFGFMAAGKTSVGPRDRRRDGPRVRRSRRGDRRARHAGRDLVARRRAGVPRARGRGARAVIATAEPTGVVVATRRWRGGARRQPRPHARGRPHRRARRRCRRSRAPRARRAGHPPPADRRRPRARPPSARRSTAAPTPWSIPPARALADVVSDVLAVECRVARPRRTATRPARARRAQLPGHGHRAPRARQAPRRAHHVEWAAIEDRDRHRSPGRRPLAARARPARRRRDHRDRARRGEQVVRDSTSGSESS